MSEVLHALLKNSAPVIPAPSFQDAAAMTIIRNPDKYGLSPEDVTVLQSANRIVTNLQANKANNAKTSWMFQALSS